MLRVALATAGPTHASAASYNNHWGVPLTLARMPRRRRLRGDRDRHESCRRDHAAGRWRARTWRWSRRLRRFISSTSARSRRIADAKAEIFSGLEPDGAAILNRDAPQFDRLEQRGARARRAGAELRRRARGRRAAARCSRGGRRVARSRARPRPRSDFVLGAPGAAHGAERPRRPARRRSARRGCRPRRGGARRICAAKGPRRALHAARLRRPVHDHRRKLQRQSRFDARRAGAARRREPGPTGAASPSSATCWNSARTALRCMRRWPADLGDNRVDLLFGAGPLTRALFDAAPGGDARGLGRALARHSRRIAPTHLRGGDVVMIKGSNGSRMGPLVAALREHFAPRDAALRRPNADLAG